MAESQYFTQAGLEKLRAELNELKTTGRKKIAAAIAEAREKGDLKENAEYDAAKHAQGLHEAEIARLENIVANARIIDESSLDTSKALILSTVTLRNKKNGAEMKYKLVSPKEADMRAGRISVESPVGKGLLGRSVGDTALVEVPAGKVEFEILAISYE
jgi:transcription elongation factor GreA